MIINQVRKFYQYALDLLTHKGWGRPAAYPGGRGTARRAPTGGTCRPTRGSLPMQVGLKTYALQRKGRRSPAALRDTEGVQALEDYVNVAEVAFEVEEFLQFGGREQLPEPGVLAQDLAEVLLT